LVARLLERKPARRLGMLAGKAADVRRHRWFDGLDWQALEARRMQPPRLPRDDSAKRLKELQARARARAEHLIAARSRGGMQRPGPDRGGACSARDPLVARLVRRSGARPNARDALLACALSLSARVCACG